MSTVVGLSANSFVVSSWLAVPTNQIVVGNWNFSTLDQQRWCVWQLASDKLDESISWVILSSAERIQQKYRSGRDRFISSSKMMLHRSLWGGCLRTVETCRQSRS